MVLLTAQSNKPEIQVTRGARPGLPAHQASTVLHPLRESSVPSTLRVKQAISGFTHRCQAGTVFTFKAGLGIRVIRASRPPSLLATVRVSTRMCTDGHLGCVFGVLGCRCAPPVLRALRTGDTRRPCRSLSLFRLCCCACHFSAAAADCRCCLPCSPLQQRYTRGFTTQQDG
jgi:hypothetical protein